MAESEYGKPLTGEEAEDILAEARERFKLSVEAEQDNRADSLDDLKFLMGEQWDQNALTARKNRPCLTINRLPTFVRQVVNEQRKTRPAIDVIPADGQASKATADVVQGLIRHIERTSRAQVAYDTAFEYAVSCGVGHFRVCTDYVDENSFDQEIKIDRIANPFSVYRDPASQEPDHTDDRYTFVTELVEVDEYEERYGFKPTQLENAGTGDDTPLWFDGKRVRVAEYWRVRDEDYTINALSTGQIVEGDLSKKDKAELAASGIEVVNTRTACRKVVEQYLISFDKVIKKAGWRGKYIPIVTSSGGEINIAGETKLVSLIRFAKDPARMYNYWTSAETEMVALQPKAPWLGAEGAFDGHEGDFAKANLENVAYLEYKPVPGEPMPSRQPPPAFPAAMREGRMAAAEDVKAVIGMYDASLGARSNETSGVALRARQQEGDTSTYHFIANHARAIEQCGRIIIDLIPKIYDTPRTIRIVGPQNEAQMAVINQMFVDPQTGQEQMHDLQLGKYDVAVRVGPSFESKRQEMVEAMVDLANANPQLMQLAGDLVVRNMDWPQSEEIADRLKAMLPPQVTGQPVPPSPEQALIQAQVQVEQIKGQSAQAKSQADAQMKGMEFQIAQQEYQIKQAELRLQELELQIKQGEAGMNAQTAGMDAQLEREKLALEHEKIQLEREKVAAQIIQAGGLMHPEQAQQKEQMMGAVVQAVQGLAQQFGGVAQALMAPKHTKLVVGPDGRPSGSVTGPTVQ
jgi:hypothetical protein